MQVLSFLNSTWNVKTRHQEKLAEFWSPGDTYFTRESDGETENVKVGEFIGQGGSSIVFSGTVQDENDVAIKCMRCRESKWNCFPSVVQPKDVPVTDWHYVKDEIDLLRKFQGKFVVQLLGVNISFCRVLLVQEMCPLDTVDIMQVLFVHGKIDLKPALMMHLFTPIMVALKKMSSMGYIHRDLKPSNILMNRDGIPKLTDFGLVAPIKNMKAGAERSGTPGFIDPAVFRDEKFSEKSDVYSMGVTFMCSKTASNDPITCLGSTWEKLIAIYKSTNEDDAEDYEYQFKAHFMPPSSPQLSSWKKFVPILMKMISLDPAERPTFAKILENKSIAQHYADWMAYMDGRPVSKQFTVFRSVVQGRMIDVATEHFKESYSEEYDWGCVE